MYKQIFILVVGLIVGGIGGAMFQSSLPPESESAQEVATLQDEISKAKLQITKLENLDDVKERMPRDLVKERAQEIIVRIRRGETVEFDDIYHAFQPYLRETAPLFNRLRQLREQQRFESLIGEYSRRYDLSQSEQGKLRSWFEQKAERNNHAFNEMLNSADATTFDLFEAMEVSNNQEEGIESVLKDILTPEEFAESKNERLLRKMERVQHEADAKLKRMEDVVDLTKEQKDELFVVFAKSSQDYTPEMQIEGVSPASVDITPGQDIYESVYQILDPVQGQTLREAQQTKRRESNEKLSSIGLEVPSEWDMLNLTPYSEF